MADEKLYSTGDISRMYGVSVNTLARAVRLGNLPAQRVGDRYALKLADVQRWLDAVYQPEMAKRSPSKYGEVRKP